MTPGSKPVSILLIEDIDDDVYFFERALAQSALPFVLKRCKNGNDALTLLGNARDGERPDLVFVDLKMPVLNGFDLLRWIRQQNFVPQLDVIVLSGSFRLADIDLAMELGATRYVVKPLKPADLKGMIEDWWQRKLGVEPVSAASDNRQVAPFLRDR